MRRALWGLWIVAWAALASAGPASTSPRPPRPGQSPDQIELTQLEKDFTQAQIKQRRDEAVKLARKIYDLTVKMHGADSPMVHPRKLALAGALSLNSDFREARKIYAELLTEAETKHGAQSREVLTALTQLTSLDIQQRHFDDSEPLYQRRLDIAKALFGDTSRDYAQELGMYGQYLSLRNEYASAMRVYEAQYKILSAALAPNDMQLMGVSQGLAMMYWSNNDQARAIDFFNRAIHIAETSPAVKPQTLGAIINGVAMQYHMGGRDDLAEPLYKRQVALYAPEIQRLDASHSDPNILASLLMQDAMVHVQMHDYAPAEQEYQRSMELQKQTSGFGASGMMLAELYRKTGKYPQAIALLEQSNRDIAAKVPSMTHAYDVSIANVLRAQRNYPRAEQLLSSYMAGAEKTQGHRSQAYSSSELLLAYIYMAAKDVPRAVRSLDDVLDTSERELKDILKLGTDADHAQYFARNPYQLASALDLNYAVAPKDPAATRLAMTTLLRRKGRALDAAAGSIAAIRNKLSPADKQLLDDLAEARAKLAQLTVNSTDRAGDPQYAKDVAALEDRIQKLELDIGKKSALYRVVNQTIDLPSVQRAIPSGAHLVEIVNYQPHDIYTVDYEAALPARRYLAYVVGHTGDPVLVDLGEAAAIDDAVEHFRKAVSDPDNDRAPELGRALYDLTIAKMTKALGGATNVLIAPDGTLNVVPFAALVDEKGDFLVKRYTFTYLTSGRDLLRLHVQGGGKKGGVVFANPAFDTGGSAPPPDGVGGSRGVRALELSQLVWPPLPGTGTEAAAVGKAMPGLHVFVGADATETALKAVHSPKILHIATHGFFLPDPPAPPANPPLDDTGGGASAMMSAAAPTTTTVDTFQNPLLRSGLVFAGANKLSSPSGEGDGILTALEASGLDLEGTELVVLSACETGVGKVTNGDGVYGLRRALVIAGAQTLVMSLWQVDDEATKDLMVGYYARLARGKSRSTALRDTQLELSRGKFQHPYYWASFVPAGDDAPL